MKTEYVTSFPTEEEAKDYAKKHSNGLVSYYVVSGLASHYVISKTKKD